MKTCTLFPKELRYYDDPPPADDNAATFAVKTKKDEKGRLILEDPEGKRLFTQEHMDAEIGKARINARKDAEATIVKLTELQNQVGMSEAAKAQLQEQIEGLQARHLSSEQQYQNELKAWRERHETDTKKLAAERDAIQKEYHEQLINSTIVQEAESNNAIRAVQVLDLLARSAKVKPVLDETGKETGSKEVVVKIRDIDATTKEEVQITLPVAKAIKRMKELPEYYGNLFRGEEKGGTGHMNTMMGRPTPKGLDLSSPQAYFDSVAKNPALVSNKTTG